VLYYGLPGVAMPYRHSVYVKDYNMEREKYVLIKFYVSNV